MHVNASHIAEIHFAWCENKSPRNFETHFGATKEPNREEKKRCEFWPKCQALTQMATHVINSIVGLMNEWRNIIAWRKNNVTRIAV
jgi:hypothetical protein